MATGVKATERVAEVIGILPSTAFRAARAMREADPTLWPAGAKGGGRGAAHVELPHLINLVLVLAATDYVTRASQIAAGWRAMVWNTAPSIRPELTGQATSVLATAGLFREDITAGEFLEGVVKLLDDGGEDVSRLLRSVGFQVTLELDSRWPRMVVGYTEADVEDDEAYHQPKFTFRPRQTPVGLSRKLDPAWNFLEPKGEQYILKSTTFLVALFELLLDLWNDTRHHTKTVPSRTPPGAPASADPERETAADSLPGAAAARLTQPSAAEQPRTSEPSHSLNRSGERKRRQSFSAEAGQSCNEERSPNAYPTDAAAS